MKIELSQHGDLVVTPDNPLERLALKAWTDSRDAGKSSNRFVINLASSPMPPRFPTDPTVTKEY